LLLLILVVFFTGELRQWASSVPRSQVWASVALWPHSGWRSWRHRLRDEVSEVERHRRAGGGDLLSGTPFEGCPVADDDRAPLARAERLKVLSKLLIAQLIQAVVFAVVVMIFFVLLASIMLPDAVIEAWSGHPVTDGDLFGLRLPAPQPTVHMSLLLAALSGLYFAVNGSIDARVPCRVLRTIDRRRSRTMAARDVYTGRSGLSAQT